MVRKEKGGRGRRYTAKEHGPRPVDEWVGKRLRARRVLVGMSQETLGHAVGLTFQQIQKYENGANRIGASRLYEFSRVLDVPVSYFFDEMPWAVKNGTSDKLNKDGLDDVLHHRESIKLVRAFTAIKDRRNRQNLINLANALANPEGNATP